MTFNAETGTGFFRVGAGIIGLAVGGLLVAQFTSGGIAGAAPIGTPIPVLDDTLPPLCVWADGRNISRTAFSALFAKWATKYGAGDGSTTFGVPDLRGRGLIGRDNIGGTDANRLAGVPASSGDRLTSGSILGEALNTLLITNMPPHNHPGGTTDLQGQHVHLYRNNPEQANYGGGPSTAAAPPGTAATEPSGIHGHNVFLASQGDGAPHNNVQSSIACNWAIYTGA